jgi:hypothetical protein
MVLRRGEFDVWFVELVREPGNARMEFGFRGAHVGRVVWGSSPWMAPVDPTNEDQALRELWAATLDLMEVRSNL